ncbi:MAG: flippase [Deltaproteobacteria bacterium]|nr:flippase [Deltaproteobacteria bacterium]
MLSFFVRMVLARRLAIEDFGLFYAIIGFLAPIGPLKNLGFSRAITRFVPIFNKKGELQRIKEALNWGILLSLGTSAILLIPFFLLAGVIEEKFFHAPGASGPFRIMLIYFVTGALAGVFTSFFHGLKKTVLISFHEVFIPLITLVLLLPLRTLDISILCSIRASAEGIALSALIIIMLKTFPYIETKSSLTCDGFKLLLGFGLKAITSPLVNRVLGRLDIIILTYLQGLTQVGLYSAAQPFARLFMIFGSSIGKMMLPYSSEWSLSGGHDEPRRILASIQRLTLFLLMPMAVLFFLLSEGLMDLFFGKIYEEGSMVVRILVFGSLLHGLTIINTNVIIGSGHPLKITKMTIVSSLFNLAGNIILIPLYGMNGAALSTLIAYFLMFAVSSHYIKHLLNHSFDWLLIIKAATSAFPMVLLFIATMRFVTDDIWILLFVIFPLALITYVLVSILNGFVLKKELISIVQKKRLPAALS